MEISSGLKDVFLDGFSVSTGVKRTDLVYQRTTYLEVNGRRAAQAVGAPQGRQLVVLKKMQPEIAISTNALISNLGTSCGTGETSICGTTVSATQAQCCLTTRATKNSTFFVAKLTTDSNILLYAQVLGSDPVSAKDSLNNALNKNAVASSVGSSFTANYATPTSLPGIYYSTTTKSSSLDGGSIAGIVIGAVFLVSALVCIFCLCTRRLVWRWAPDSTGTSQSLEVVCIPREDGKAKQASHSPTRTTGAPRMTVREPGAAAPAAATQPPSPPRATPAPASPAESTPIITPKAFMDAASKQGGDMKAVLSALAATPSLASSVDEATGITAVMKAIRGKDVGVVKAILAAYPAGVNVADKNGATPLHHAVVYQNLEIISVLVGAGADLSAKDVHGETQLELARKLLKQGHHRNDLVVKALEAVNP